MKKALPLFLIFLSFSGFSQKIRLVTEKDIPGIQITRHDSFSGDGLYNYLDRGADLIMEYGFKKVYVNQYSRENSKVTFECYIMEDAPSAFGIYSVSASQCMFWNNYSTFSCATPNGISVALGPLYIDVINSGGGQDGFGLCELIVKSFLAKNPQEQWYAPPMVQEQRLSPFLNTLCYYKGRLGVNIRLPMWSDLFGNYKFNLYSINIRSQSFSGILGRIVFDDSGSLNIFLMRAGINGPSTQLTPIQTSPGIWRSWVKVNENKIIFLEGTSSSLKLGDYIPPMPDVTW